MKDILICYSRPDRSWAEWIAWQLGALGLATICRDKDDGTPSDFFSDTRQGEPSARHTIVLLSPSFKSVTEIESQWNRAHEKDPAQVDHRLILIRVKPVDQIQSSGTGRFTDLFDLKEEKALMRLIEQVRSDSTNLEAQIQPPGPDAHCPPFPGETPAIWNIPLHRNPDFTGRETKLSQLAADFNSARDGKTIQVIKGMGGIGKTQVAIEYAYRYASNYQVVWWLRAEDEETLVADIVAFANAVELCGENPLNERMIIHRVLNWLDRNRRWLFVFDNVIRPEDIREYLPQGTNGHVLMTSRYQAWEKVCRSISIERWSRAESLEFIVKRIKSNDIISAEQVAEAAGDLPLVLQLATAYVEATALRMVDYLESFNARQNELWGERNLPLTYPVALGTALSLSIEKVQAETPIGAMLLSLCSCVAAEKTPQSLIHQAIPHVPDAWSALFKGESLLDQAIAVVNRYALLTALPDSVLMHRLLQVAVRDRMHQSERRLWSEVAARAVKSCVPPDSATGPDRRSEWVMMLPHVRMAIAHAIENGIAWDAAADLLNCLGLQLSESSSFDRAEPFFRRALEIYEKRLGIDHPTAVVVMDNLAGMIRNQGKYAQAEPLYRQVLRALETRMGSDHPLVAMGLNNLAVLLLDQSQYTEAERLFRRALSLHEQRSSGIHPDAAMVMMNLGLLLQEMGKHDQAEPFYRQAMNVLETQLGENHPSVADSNLFLASLLQEQGKHDQAEPLYRRALNLLEARMGKNHPSVAKISFFLASLLQERGSHDQAEPLYRRAMEVYEKRYGKNHLSIAICLNNLALSLHDQGRVDQAEPLYEQALKIRESTVGGDHHTVATCLNNLALLLQDQGRIDQAGLLYQRALSILESQLGDDHPDFFVCMRNFAGLLKYRGDLEESDRLLSRVSAGWRVEPEESSP